MKACYYLCRRTDMQRIQDLKFEDYIESDILEVLTQVIIQQNSLGDPFNFYGNTSNMHKS